MTERRRSAPRCRTGSYSRHSTETPIRLRETALSVAGQRQAQGLGGSVERTTHPGSLTRMLVVPAATEVIRQQVTPADARQRRSPSLRAATPPPSQTASSVLNPVPPGNSPSISNRPIPGQNARCGPASRSRPGYIDTGNGVEGGKADGGIASKNHHKSHPDIRSHMNLGSKSFKTPQTPSWLPSIDRTKCTNERNSRPPHLLSLPPCFLSPFHPRLPTSRPNSPQRYKTQTQCPNTHDKKKERALRLVRFATPLPNAIPPFLPTPETQKKRKRKRHVPYTIHENAFIPRGRSPPDKKDGMKKRDG